MLCIAYAYIQNRFFYTTQSHVVSNFPSILKVTQADNQHSTNRRLLCTGIPTLTQFFEPSEKPVLKEFFLDTKSCYIQFPVDLENNSGRQSTFNK